MPTYLIKEQERGAFLAVGKSKCSMELVRKMTKLRLETSGTGLGLLCLYPLSLKGKLDDILS